MKNILILSAGRRVSLVRGFMDASLRLSESDIRICTADMAPHLSAACQISDTTSSLPHVLDGAYADALLSLCNEENIGLIVPTIDTELPVLAALRDQFLDAGVTILVSDAQFIKVCGDKRDTADFFTQNGLPTPEMYSPSDLKFPVLVKPYDGSLSAGVHLLKSDEDVTSQILENSKNLFCEYIDHSSHQEFTVDMYYDKSSYLRCVVPRRRIEVRGGEVSKALTEKNEIVPLLLDKMGYVEGARGCLTLQLFRNPETHRLYFIEINARFGGGYPLSRLAAADFQSWIIQEYLLGEHIDFMNDWHAKTLMLRYDAEVIVTDYAEE